METSLEFPQNFALLYDLAVPLLGIYPKEIKSLLGKNIRIPVSIMSITNCENNLGACWLNV